MYSARYFCPTLTKFGVSEQIFVKIPNIKLHEKPYRGSGPDTCGQEDRRMDRRTDWVTDRYDEAKQALFSIYSNAPKTRL